MVQEPRDHPERNQMKLIAVTGEIGTGKTELLSDLANHFLKTGRTIDGFCAEASGRVPGENYAARYDLRWIASGKSIPFAQRDENRFPPYRFNPAATKAVRAWATALETGPPLDLLILDEFGPVEALGGGHVAIWPQIKTANPEVVVIVTREWLLEIIEKKLDHIFQTRLDAGQPNALQKLIRFCRIKNDNGIFE